MLDGAEEKCEMMLSVGTKPQRAVVLWCCGAVVLRPRIVLLLWRCVGVQEEEETLERWTSASAEMIPVMMSWRHGGARSDCLQCCNVPLKPVFCLHCCLW